MNLNTLILLLWVTMAHPSQGGDPKRIALVIGNSAYAGSQALVNPQNDAADVAIALGELGFEVIKSMDLDRRQMLAAVNKFSKRLEDTNAIGLFYYAGHGVEVDGESYLLPLEADVQSQIDLEFESLNIQRVIGRMQDARKGLNIVLIDACRNNPFRGYRGFSNRRGISEISAPLGTFISSSTASGEFAADGFARNSPYTKQLLKHIRTPGLSLEQVFKKIRIGVIQETNELQIPWETSSLTTDFYFASPKEFVSDVDPQKLNHVSSKPQEIKAQLAPDHAHVSISNNNPENKNTYLTKIEKPEISFENDFMIARPISLFRRESNKGYVLTLEIENKLSTPIKLSSISDSLVISGNRGFTDKIWGVEGFSSNASYHVDKNHHNAKKATTVSAYGRMSLILDFRSNERAIDTLLNLSMGMARDLGDHEFNFRKFAVSLNGIKVEENEDLSSNTRMERPEVSFENDFMIARPISLFRGEANKGYVLTLEIENKLSTPVKLSSISDSMVISGNRGFTDKIWGVEGFSHNGSYHVDKNHHNAKIATTVTANGKMSLILEFRSNERASDTLLNLSMGMARDLGADDFNFRKFVVSINGIEVE